MPAIQTKGLSKTYTGGKEALKGLNLSIAEGEVFGFLGPNGAGKTTAVKLLCGLLQPSDGESSVLGINPAFDAARLHATCGVVTEHAQMYDHLSATDNLRFYGELYGLSADESAQRARELLSDMQLSEAGHRKLAEYSTGMRQRLSLARALMHRPMLLFLDEPTSGLDPESTLHVNHMISRLAKEQGCTIFLCTHQLRYAQEICSRYGLIDQGELLTSGTLDELRRTLLPGLRLSIRTSKAPEQANLCRLSDNLYEARLSGEDEIPALVRSIVLAGGDVYEVTQELPSLEAIYFALTGGREAGHEAS